LIDNFLILFIHAELDTLNEDLIELLSKKGDLKEISKERN